MLSTLRIDPLASTYVGVLRNDNRTSEQRKSVGVESRLYVDMEHHVYLTDANKYLLLLLRQNGVDLGVHLMFSERTLYLETVYFKEDRNLDIEENSIASFISDYSPFLMSVIPQIVSCLVSMTYAVLEVLAIHCCGHSKVSIDLC